MAESSSSKISNVCIFCGSSPGINDEFTKEATILGRELASRKINLTLTGGSLGFLGCVSTGAYSGGHKVLGIIPTDIPTMPPEMIHDRISKVLSFADSFIALPGGLATLDEIFRTVSWIQCHSSQKPIGLLNIAGFYDGLLSYLDFVVEQKLMTPKEREMFISAPTAVELIDKLLAFQSDPPVVPVPAPAQDSDKEPRKKPRVDLDLSL